MTPHFGPRFHLNLLELEPRDVPAWWAVTAPDPAAGVAGSTDATHSGGLAFNPAYDPVGGVVEVWADTAVGAAIEAIRGTVTVSLNGQSVNQVFGPATVGTAADHKAFAVAASGMGVSIAFEDMVGFTGVTPDHDYNDRGWSLVSVTPAARPPVVLVNATRTLTGGSGDARVDVLVTSDTSGPAEVYHWKYTVSGVTLELDSQEYSNNYQLDITAATDGLTEPYTDYCPVLGVAPTGVGVNTYYDEDRTGLLPGDSFVISFDTPARPIVRQSAWMYNACNAYVATAMIEAPAPRPTVSATFATEFIPVNANNDNFREVKDAAGKVTNEADRWLSAAQKYVPKHRDYQVDGPYSAPDAELVPVTVTVGGGLAGIVTAGALPQMEQAGDVRFWADNKKAVEFTSKVIPAGAAPPFTIFVEGVEQSLERDDILTTVTFTAANAAGAITATDTHLVTVTPVVENTAHLIGGPTITFAGDGKPADGSTGITTQGWPDAQGRRPSGVDFKVDILAGSFENRAAFLQNQVSVLNGYNNPSGAGYGQTFFNPTGHRDYKLTQQALNAGAAYPLLDAESGQVLYPTFKIQDGSYAANDSPNIAWDAVLGSKITRVDILQDYRMHFVVIYPDQSVYSLGYWDWSVNLFATSAAPTLPTLTHIPADAKVTVRPWVLSNADPRKTVGPVANDANFLY